MLYLKFLFWFLLGCFAAVFTYGNWTSVPIHLWNNMVAETNLPLLILIAFLVGLLPTLIVQHVARWRLRLRLAAAERQLSDLRALPLVTAPPAPPPATALHAAAMPPVSADAESATGPGMLL